jgi:hypothetical protein
MKSLDIWQAFGQNLGNDVQGQGMAIDCGHVGDFKYINWVERKALFLKCYENPLNHNHLNSV